MKRSLDEEREVYKTSFKVRRSNSESKAKKKMASRNQPPFKSLVVPVKDIKSLLGNLI